MFLIMTFDAIVTQGHIPHYDPQGGLSAARKKHLFNLSLANLRQNNPNAFIVLSGHGVTCPELDYVDAYYWEDKCRPMATAGYVEGLPAQYTFVDIGLELVEEAGFTSCLKTRTDCIIQRENITSWCQEILEKENRQILLTQQSGGGRIGDCFMYGNVSDLRKIWHRDNPVHSADGLLNTGFHFEKAFPRKPSKDFLTYVREYASFRDVTDIPFICLRWGSGKITDEEIMENRVDVSKHHWGRVNEWHIFDDDGNMIKAYNPNFWSRRDFYGN